MRREHLARNGFAFTLLAIPLVFANACSKGTSASNPDNSTNKKVVRISIGTQDQVINTATGGSIIREEKLLEKYLPKTGKYQNVDYKIEWSSYTSGPPITNKMLANQIDIGLMGDFPATINMTTFQQKGRDVRTNYIATLGYSPMGAGNAIVVPKDSTVKTLTDLKGKQVSVPFGSAAHGMLLKALKGAQIDPEKDLKLVSQSPEVGGSNLQTKQIDAHADFVPFGELFSFRGFAKKIFDGAQTNVPTLHGVLVRSDFAKTHPEVVVAYLKALLDANKMFREQPEVIATKVEKWTGVEREVVYMFIGLSGLQKLDPTIRQVHLEALRNSVVTLKQLGKLDASITPETVLKQADETYLKQAMQEMGLKYNDVVATADSFTLAGKDAQTGEKIANAKMAAQVWLEGENKVMNFASIQNMMAALQKLKADGKTTSAIFVHDHHKGWKLFAENSFFVRQGNEVSAFLTQKDAQAFAKQANAQVATFQGLQQSYAQTAKPVVAASNR